MMDCIFIPDRRKTASSHRVNRYPDDVASTRTMGDPGTVAQVAVHFSTMETRMVDDPY